MVLLVIGTVAQKDIGLYQAEQIYFSSWFFWFGFVPLPGGLSTLLIIFINLLAKFLLKSKWTWRQSGTIITHFGILLLFVGALFTALTTKEGFLLIPEGHSNDRLLDYHQKVFYLFKDEQQIAMVPFENLENLRQQLSEHIPFKIQPLYICKNCQFLEVNKQEIIHRKGLAEKISLSPAPIQKEDEANLSGVTFRISGSQEQDGIYISTEAAPHPVIIVHDDVNYRLQLQRAETQLPFTVTLDDFVRKLHPGTQTPSHYHSDIQITDRDMTWSTRIAMNEPLRYKGYTLFQSSYADTPKGQATILAVVKNNGWLFPYIASAIIALGLLIHLFLKIRGAYV